MPVGSRSRRLAQITLNLPGPGRLSAKDASASSSAKPLIKSRPRATKAGKLTLTLKPTSTARKLLAKGKKVRITVKVTFTPTGGLPASKTTKVTLKKAKRKKS